jgi:hypothetical protein
VIQEAQAASERQRYLKGAKKAPSFKVGRMSTRTRTALRIAASTTMRLPGPEVAPWLLLVFAGAFGVATLQLSDPLLVLQALCATAAGGCLFQPLTLSTPARR